MEVFESFVALAMEHEGLVVSPAVKFDMTPTDAQDRSRRDPDARLRKSISRARVDLRVLATVRSFSGSRGVVGEHVTGETRVARSRTL